MTAQEAPSDRLRRLINGYQVTQAIHVAATLGVADHLGNGSLTSDELALATHTDPRTLYRLLRTLASLDVLREEDGRRFFLTSVGECLRSDAPEPIAGWAAFVGRPYHWDAWSSLLHSVQTGENAFAHVHGTDVWRYRAERPEESKIFDRAMADLTRTTNQALLDAFDFGRFSTIVDVGGGNGAFLAAVLGKHPDVRGVLFDMQHVVAGAVDVLRAAGVDDRCEIVGGSFFESVPAGGDAYVLKSILLDWDDQEAGAILRNCRKAASDMSVVVAIGRILGPPNEDAPGKLSDLNMLVSTGGYERSTEEFVALFEASGFEMTAVTPSSSGLSLIEGAARMV
jgi:O-methyltransferase domain/Dimerisation domain